jgi:hypothetical protein
MHENCWICRSRIEEINRLNKDRKEWIMYARKRNLPREIIRAGFACRSIPYNEAKNQYLIHLFE